MLELAQTEALAIRRIETDIAHIVDLIDTLVIQCVGRSGIHNCHALGIDIHIEPSPGKLVVEDTLNIVMSTLLGVHSRHHEKPERLILMALQKLHKAHDGQILTLTLAVAVGIEKHDRIRWKPDVLAESQPSCGWKVREDGRVHCVLHHKRGCSTILRERLRPGISEAKHLVSSLVQLIHQRLSNSSVHLINIEPQLVRSLTLHILHGVDEPSNDHRVIVDHDHIRSDHLQILMDLVEAKSLLLRILIGCCVIGYNAIGDLADVLALRMALKSKVKGLDLRRKRGSLSQQIGHDLRVSSRLIDVSANENKAHCVYSLGSV